MRALICFAFSMLCLSLPTVVPGVETTTADNLARPRIGLVLSGGGARGLAHVGVLQMLEDLRVPIDCIAGTSMGALVGGSYAAGVSPEKMRDVLSQSDLVELFDDLPPRSEIPLRIKRDSYRPLFDFTVGFRDGEVLLPTGASAGYKFEFFLKDLIGQGPSIAGLDFDELPTPFRAIATDLESGDMRVFSEGELIKVMRASMSLPGVIAPTRIGAHIYVDGGLVRNLPVDIVRELCGDIIIAVNAGTPLLSRNKINSVIDVADQSINLLTEQNVKRSLSELNAIDVLIEPALDDIGATDFELSKDIIESGVQAGLKASSALSQLSLSASDYAHWKNAREQRTLAVPEIHSINISAANKSDAETLLHDVHTQAGETFNTDALHKDLARIYGRGDFSYLGYRVIPDDTGASIEIETEAKTWGPNFLKFGVGGIADFNTPAQFNLAASYRRSWKEWLGAEWRNDVQLGYDSFLKTEYIQPLQIRDGAFIAGHAGLRRYVVQFYNDDVRIGQYIIKAARIGLDLGISSPLGELRIGPFVNTINAQPDFGVITATVPSVELTQVGYELAAIYDQLDSLSFPRSGSIAELSIRGSKPGWGSDDEYTRAQLRTTAVYSVGKSTLSASIELGEEINCCIQAYDPFQLGGPLRLSGLNLDQLTGSRYQLGRFGMYRQYSNLPSQFGRGMYYGAYLEAGRIDDPLKQDPYDWIRSVSAYWGADTVLGTLVIGYGVSSLNQRTAYLMLGPRF
jgi:NTE family protein